MTQDQSSPALSIIVISYNTRDLTVAAIDSVFQYPPPVPFELIVLDNASSDGSAEAIAARFPEVRLIASKDNVGFAAGNNVAAEQARGDRLLLLNPDTLLFDDALAQLLAFADRQPHRGIWGGRTLFPDRTLNPTSCWRRMTLWSVFCSASGLTYIFPRSRLFNSEAYGDWDRGDEADVDIVTGCFLLIDHALWKRLNGFDPTFFMYAEEADLCLRAKALGAQPGITPGAQLVHYGGASEVTGIEKVVKTTRGRVTLMRKHWGPLAFAAGRTMLLLWSFARMMGSFIWSGRQDGAGQSRAKWQDIWQRRAEWLAGYPILSPEKTRS
jgi:GT2 family glycosyltransferase